MDNEKTGMIKIDSEEIILTTPRGDVRIRSFCSPAEITLDFSNNYKRNIFGGIVMSLKVIGTGFGRTGKVYRQC
jgi:hypothetical protein